MIKKHLTLILSIAAMFLISFTGYAQTDSSMVIVHDQFNKAVETIVLPAIFSLLGATGINLTPFAALITFIVMFIIRRIEKKRIDKKVANNLREIITTETDGSEKETLGDTHRNKLQRFLDRLEGVKHKKD